MAWLVKIFDTTERCYKDAPYKGGALPVGTITEWSDEDETELPPEGWLYCDGSWVNKEDYENLYDVIGDTYEPEEIPAPEEGGPEDPTLVFWLPLVEGSIICYGDTEPTTEYLGRAVQHKDGAHTIRFGVTADGQWGYIKDDTEIVIPFKSEIGADGNAQPEDVREGRTFSNSGSLGLTGTWDPYEDTTATQDTVAKGRYFYDVYGTLKEGRADIADDLGNARVSEVIVGRTFSSDYSGIKKEGTLPDRRDMDTEAIEFSIGGGGISLTTPAGAYSRYSRVYATFEDYNLDAHDEDVILGKNYIGFNATPSTGTLPVRSDGTEDLVDFTRGSDTDPETGQPFEYIGGYIPYADIAKYTNGVLFRIPTKKWVLADFPCADVHFDGPERLVTERELAGGGIQVNINDEVLNFYRDSTTSRYGTLAFKIDYEIFDFHSVWPASGTPNMTLVLTPEYMYSGSGRWKESEYALSFSPYSCHEWIPDTTFPQFIETSRGVGELIAIWANGPMIPDAFGPPHVDHWYVKHPAWYYDFHTYMLKEL